MLETDAIKLIHDALIVVMKAAGPMLILSMITGLVISILQTTTSIQEQTLTFVPKLIAVFLAIMVFSAYIIHTTVDYTVGVFELIRRF
ncbi:MAG TPA: EscS/YscS/HrcS family type III secretion system export apparatus protein [Leptospiraceae bacterium]|jgi:flagellar biosynthetic protein FliQ|nr:EscS/YscS/HrcS family type III secretion system export apparatus protein [Leptospiraceae bacterium]MBR33733.1 EscS/YscS/HrcS family type III secretion system export apparatus protein [Spirochaetaceae bacterium]HBS05861.1 EscS/YscS/HrcS family type III secretion system export apparatus protein [Leptospiraceae bacterium]|tara:strand:- start:19456 stop:19719 length:264 start_codon:yes stop_codon:yes gene_type:complete